MDGIYRHQRHIYDATRKFYLLGRDHLIVRLDPPQGGSVLEIGCGTGRNMLAAGRRYPYARFCGIDISEAMLKTAATNIARAGEVGRIRIAAADAADFDTNTLFGVPAFDRVVFSYTLSMIPPWREALAVGLAHLKPGGRAHIVDFGQQERLPAAFRGLLFAWLKGFHVTPRADLREALEEAAGEEAEVSFAPLYRGYAWYGEVSSQSGER
ncbi:SAM-dependent methyltransferase [Rhodobium orientis]|uniref:SAM-dependent methyltransferase n=2 Tax=Rhodobium orientis TaxID=34017 RepID=A0A327JES3_9HYPH|nr:class I SAM-dependent methyltransferase [Rhodobium orientis]MBK5948644.1 SAM-dependent methyltransferase [Rhodobium orientis]RAI24900.1 SAM-dependent methyltransferase [Rhodobium orientis]